MEKQTFQGFDLPGSRKILAYLLEMPAQIVARGLELVRRGAMREAWWEVPDQVLHGEVQGGQRYVQTIVLGPKWVEEVWCSCPYGSDCKHVFALLETLTVRWPVRAPTGEKPAPKAAPVLSPLTTHLAGRLGRSLNRREQELVRDIEGVWKANYARIPEQRLLQLAGHTEYFYEWQKSEAALWSPHRPPASAIEAFYYLADALRDRKRLPNIPAFSTIDWKEADLVLAPWRREKGIVAWQSGLREMAQAQTSPPPSVEFRLMLLPEGGVIEWKLPRTTQFKPVKPVALRQHAAAALQNHWRCDYLMDDQARRFLKAVMSESVGTAFLEAGGRELQAALSGLLRQPGFEGALVTAQGTPLSRDPAPLRWTLEGPVVDPQVETALVRAGADPALAGDYVLVLRTGDGSEAPPALASLKGWPCLHVTHERVYELPEPFPADTGKPCRMTIPATALESADGVAALRKLRVPLPERLASLIESVPYQVSVRCRHRLTAFGPTESFQLSARATAGGRLPDEYWAGWDWIPRSASATAQPGTPAPDTRILCPDRSLPDQAKLWLQAAGTNTPPVEEEGRMWVSRSLQGAALRDFPEAFLLWLDQRPQNITVELDAELDSLLHGRVSGSMRLEMEETGVDWFDVRVALDVSDVELTDAEINILLKAKGRWVRLPGKGWRRLEFQLSDEDQAQLADLGLAVGDLAKSESQRLHVFQLAGAAGTKLLPPERAVEVKRRAEELRTAVTPEVPAAITASLRPYQRDGYHFLAYLSANRFGGILADDMGLGKTVQTLSWLAWLRETGQLPGPALVVCPKSVQDNWRAEVARFCPGFRVRLWSRDTAGVLEDPAPAPPAKKAARKASKTPPPGDDLVIINYTQLRLHEKTLLAQRWAAVVLDEAQYIKNPSSQTTKAACALQTGHRLALSGTPIENRLLDLWSILNFAMPGVLGNRTAFNRQFNGKDDPLARRRLAARVRQFVLRRTKKEVARDLPDRTEEEIVCDLEGPQAALYRAELKRARAILLKAKTSAQLDTLRFNILTSLLRLRQICCHPALVGAGKPEDESAKLAALLDLLEPLMEEGHKVLVFSQFVEMLELIRAAVAARDWPHLLLTGQTEDRGALVDGFQRSEGGSIFLISLKAGGFGLNLTAASYVVLFDPWWNPAVENQAIDRTHRIGQTNKVIAYRLLVRETIEEKIRKLQSQKSALASDILGEENFAKALSLDDFRFLLGDGEGVG